MSKSTNILAGILVLSAAGVWSDYAPAQLSAQAKEVIKQGIAAREALGPNDPSRTLRVQIDAGDGLQYRAYRPEHRDLEQMVMVVDEPPERGGTDTGPSPIAYFAAGVGACLLNQFIRLAVADDIDLTFSRMNLQGQFRREVGGGFESITHEVYASGTASADEIRSLTERVDDYCYIHATLRKVIALTTVVHVNGVEAARTESAP